ncbi:hypothetical protein MTR67_044481, partial [Solanum verrucosum]
NESPMFYGSKVEEYRLVFIDEIYKVLMIVCVTPVEMAELDAYQIKGVAQVWFNQWKEERAVDAGPLDWKKFKGAFLDRFFPLEIRDEKVLEFINLRQGNMSVKEYALKFTKFCKYVLFIVADLRARMSKFVSGASEMIHAEQIKEEKLKERSREAKRAKTSDGDFPHSSSNGHDRSRFRRRFSGQGSSKAPTPKFNKERVSNPKPQGGSGGGNIFSIPSRQKCGKSHSRKWLMGTDNCFGCGKSCHCLRDSPYRIDKGKDGRHAPPSGSDSSAPKQNRFYRIPI